MIIFTPLSHVLWYGIADPSIDNDNKRQQNELWDGNLWEVWSLKQKLKIPPFSFTKEQLRCKGSSQKLHVWGKVTEQWVMIKNLQYDHT